MRALVETGALQGNRGIYRLTAPLASIQVLATVQAIPVAPVQVLRTIKYRPDPTDQFSSDNHLADSSNEGYRHEWLL